MENSNGKNKALHIFLGIFVLVAAGVGGYLWWDSENIKKINATTVTIEEAQAMAQQVLSQ